MKNFLHYLIIVLCLFFIGVLNQGPVHWPEYEDLIESVCFGVMCLVVVLTVIQGRMR